VGKVKRQRAKKQNIMTKKQFAAAFKIAQTEKDWSKIDDSALHGCALKEFQPVIVPLESVAKMTFHIGMMFSGQWDMGAVNEFFTNVKKKIYILE
jgi:hypothetical protein